MTHNYCLPIIKRTKAEVLEKITLAHDYHYFEVWLDYIEDLDFDFVHELLTYKDRIIFVLRRQHLETTTMETQRRLSIISAISKSECMLDLDVITQQEELSYIQNNNLEIPLITSYHDYQSTPEEKKLIEVMSIMMNYKPAIIKIATKCNKPEDGLRLLDLLLSLKKEKKKYIILGMGEYGTITRLYGALWGNEFIFAPEKKEEASAPGQLTRQEMQTVLAILNESETKSD